MKIENKTALVTGGTSGIGLATAALFLENGAKVMISGTGRNSEEAEALAKKYGEEKVAFFSYDTSQLPEIEKLAEFVRSKFGKLDIAFLNAGLALTKPFEEITEEIFDKVINTNLKGVYFTLQKLLPLLNQGASVILNTSASVHKAHAGTSIYAASKAAILNLVRTLNSELIRKGIRINAVSPGPTETGMFNIPGLSEEKKQEIKNNIGKGVPIGRMIRPEEIAQAVLYLASPESSSQIGTEIIVDGGMLLG